MIIIGKNLEGVFPIFIKAGLTPFFVPGKDINYWDKCWYCAEPSPMGHVC